MKNKSVMKNFTELNNEELQEVNGGWFLKPIPPVGLFSGSFLVDMYNHFVNLFNGLFCPPKK